MAYYLVSLVEILEQILHPAQHNQNWVLDSDKIPQIQSLLEHATFLRDGFAVSERLSRARIERMEDRIKDMVENVEDDIVTCQNYKISLPDLQEVIGQFESAKEEMTEIINASGRPRNQRLDYPSPVVSSQLHLNPKNMVVGVTEDLHQLQALICGFSSNLEIIHIVGMVGSGKTTLARILYDDRDMRHRFDICAWVTISHNYNPLGILQSLLDCVTPNSTTGQEIDELMCSLHKCLYGRRYFIVLDDIWSSEAWDVVKPAFPDDNNSSRIILTTRENNLADYVRSKGHQIRHQMRLLNEDDSWDLLRKKVYDEESCPSELEEIGKRIAKSCKGLPLALQVIGGLLKYAERSKDLWEQVASDVTACLVNVDEQILGIFSSSYVHLPHYLKPCFLYMCAFPEIKASKLIKLWVAEGFLWPIGDRSPAEIAEDYLKLLVEKNLIFARQKNWDGKVKSYGVHDVLRDIFMKKAEEKKLIVVKNLKDNNLLEDTLRIRRVCVHSLPDKYKHVSSSVKLTPLARSVLCMTIGNHEYILSSLCFDLSLLRVLDVLEIVFPMFPERILQLVNLRYLALYCDSGFPDNISVLRNLQTLIIGGCFISHFTRGIFDILQLRHLHFHGLRYMKGFDEFDRSFGVQEKLQSLSTIPLEMLTRLFLGKIPNLRKLGISYSTNILFTYSTDIFDLTCFNKLETLKFYGNHDLPKLPNLVFPDSLRKLTLWWCTVSQTFLNTISMLPNLEALKLQDIAFENLTWEPSEGQFDKLQYLQLLFVDLENWLADETHFPMLQHLVIRCCYRLKEIPLEIGGIETLEIIEVDEDSRMARASARIIMEEQHNMGNNIFQLRVRPGFLKNTGVDEEIVKNMKKCAFSFQ